MVPLVVGAGAGKEILQPLAVVVLGGLFTSTALTLLVLPALYSMFGKFMLPTPSGVVTIDHASTLNRPESLPY
jgi:Cu/Ag efflux pump CusA